MSILLTNVSKKYGTQLALDSVSFKLSKGEIVGLLGPNGAGKSTCMKILCGYISNYEGTAMAVGFDLRTDAKSARRHTGYLPEHNPLYLDMYVREYLRFIASIFQIEKPQMRIKELVDLTGLGDEQQKKIRSLSKGYRQRVGLAQALIQDPDVLILDEPTSGLDPNQLVEIRQLIRELGREKTVLFSSHILQEVEALCQRVLVLNQGELVADRQLITGNRDIHVIQVEYDKPIDDAFFEVLQFDRVQFQNDHSATLHISGKQDPRPAIFDHAVKAGYRILHMQREEESIADLFVGLTKSNT